MTRDKLVHNWDHLEKVVSSDLEVGSGKFQKNIERSGFYLNERITIVIYSRKIFRNF